MAKSMLVYGFEHINEDQLWDVIERVKRDKRRRRNADWLAYSSRKKEEIRSCTSLLGGNFTERVHCDAKCKQSLLEVNERQKYEAIPESVDSLQILDQKEDNYFLLLNNTQFRQTLQKIGNIRRCISGILDSILAQSEVKMLKENIFKDPPMKFEESENKRRVMNYRCRILRLNYQLVMDMRKLSQTNVKDDAFLDTLSKCHSTASKILQVFVHEWYNLMKIDQIRKIFSELLKSVIILSGVCKTVCDNIGGLNDFIIYVLNKKCSTILHVVDKKFGKEIQEKIYLNAEEEMNMKRIEHSNKKHQSTEYVDLNKTEDPVSIPMKAFKKLARKHFDSRKCRVKFEKDVKMLPQDVNSGRVIGPAKMSQGKRVKHSSNVIHKKTSANESEINEKSNSSSRKQYISYLESEIQNFDIESFSKKLYTTLEKEICSNMKCIFNNFSFGQLQIYHTAEQNNDRHVFYHGNHLEILRKIKKTSLHLPESEEIPLEIECKNIYGKEVMETNIDNPKQDEENFSLKDKEKEYMVLKKHTSGAYDSLQLRATSPNSENTTVEPYKTPKELKHSSSNRLLDGEEDRILLANTITNQAVSSVLGLEPWDAIGRISDKLIAECIKGISSQLDFCILQNIFDQEFL